MKMIKTIIVLYLSLIIFGCGTAVTKPPAKKEEAAPQEASVQSEKTPNPEGLRHFMDGQVMMNQGDFAMAIIEFQQAVELDPSVGAIHTSIAECYWNLGKPDMAEKHLKKALKLDSKDELALQMLADQYILQKNYMAAQNPFEQLHALKPDEVKYIIALAELEKLKQNYSESLKLYQDAFDLEPSRPELLETAGRLALQMKDIDQAQSIFKRLTELDPNRPQYMGMYIDLVMNTKNYQEGIDFIKKLNAEYGESLDRMAQMGLLLYQVGEKAEALKLLKSAVENSPENPNYYFSLFDLYMNSNDNENASKIADQLVINFPEDWRGYYSRSLVFIDEKKPEEVVTLLGSVSDTFKKIFSIQYLLGLGHNQLKQFEEAKKYFLRALSIRPNSPNVLHSMAILYDEVEEWKKSDEIYIRLIKSDSTDAQAFNNYAYSLVEREHNLEKALTMAKKAITLDPDNPSYLDTIGWIYFKLNDNNKARKYIEASVKIKGDNAIVLEHLGDVFMKIQEVDNALDYYQRALDLDKKNVRLIKKVSPE